LDRGRSSCRSELVKPAALEEPREGGRHNGGWARSEHRAAAAVRQLAIRTRMALAGALGRLTRSKNQGQYPGAAPLARVMRRCTLPA
jgi:hypothetical protein